MGELTAKRRSALLLLLSRSSVLVIEADDIVLAEVGSALDLDELERHLAGIGQAVARSGGDIGRLVFLEQRYLLADRDLGGAADDRPMLRAVEMHLQR